MAKSRKSIDELWEAIFNDFKIDEAINEKGFFEITAKQIKEYKEPCLMTKFDNSSALPSSFYYNKNKNKSNKYLSILPTTRGSYIIGAFDAYHRLEEVSGKVKRIDFPSQYETLNININSEAIALNVAYISGILSDFINDDNLMPTVNGRMSSGKFDFHMKLDTNRVANQKDNLSIKVEKAQIEIDGGYEGSKTLSLIEAKNVISDDFLVRQIYFPYRIWSNKIRKEINNIFMTHSNGTFNLYQYEFTKSDSPASIKLVKSQIYTLNPPIDLGVIIKITDNIKIMLEPEIPFPQADDLRKVLSLCEALNQSEDEPEYQPLTKEGVAAKFGFHMRQSDYYINAARYLGFIEITKGKNTPIKITQLGKEVFSKHGNERNIEIVKAILAHRVFNECFKLYLKNSCTISKADIVTVMKESSLYNLDKDKGTYVRRAGTISAWIKWIFMLIN